MEVVLTAIAKSKLHIRRVDSELETLRSSGPVPSFGLLFGILRDASDDSVVGVGFQLRGKRGVFWRARNDSGSALEQGDGSMEFLDRLLSRLRIFDEDQETFRGEWSRVLDVFRSEHEKAPPRPIVRLRDAMANMRPEATRVLTEILSREGEVSA